ncbi:ADP-ribosylation factor-binding protein GGA1 [Trichonephila inaurata madagascariensis]|uniref:ADP-ribosylation factor-binding protein GGA1 n=1 Tax=Trichonephila inaurata madagascariensis TaxID=2747483 RepID=A0A8X7BZY2_9ARAC|nr:ADP-ribosylation factor-binding protein GGA1 [Trichonephila inaurata madagascariensis]
MATAEPNEYDNLETILAKATNPLYRKPDSIAVLNFCEMIDKEHDGPQTALRLLAHKIQSPIEKESLMALSVLEECVRNCGIRFRSEIGKFRFLNEMIKVVSPKYLGNRASTKVKQKIVELMYIWSLELKNESKIAEAYQMLKRQGVVIEDPVYVLNNYEPPPPPPPRVGNSIFEDEEKAQQLQKLLRSRNAEDLQAANRLIKNMVREADKKMELMAKRSTELETVHNNASVLEDMLNHYRPGETSEEEKDLMKELFESCERLRPKLFRLAGELDEKDEGLGDILKANDELTVVINNYKKIMGVSSENGNISSKEASLLDLGSPIQESQPNAPIVGSSLLDDQLLALGLGDSVKETLPSEKVNATKSSTHTSSSLADLDQIFSSSSKVESLSSMNTTISLPVTTSVISNNFSASIFRNDASDVPSLTPLPPSSLSTANAPSSNSIVTSKGLEELDELGQSLLKKSLPITPPVKYEFPNAPQKVPLSQLMQQQKNNPKGDASLSSTVSLSQDVSDVPCLISSSPVSDRVSPACSPAHTILSLKDVFVPLESVQPGTMPPMNLHEKNGLSVVIHFGKDSPRPDITVMVVSTMSKNSSPVKNVSFQAAVPKTMKIKLQPPSATDLPPHNPILPPAAITQVMLLANPQKEDIRFKYKVSYTINGEDFTDQGEVR